MLSLQGALRATRGILRSDEDRERGTIIEQLLCNGSAQLSSRLETVVAGRLRRFIDRDLASLQDGRLVVAPDGLPYVRTIASLFDSFRAHQARRFSSAI